MNFSHYYFLLSLVVVFLFVLLVLFAVMFWLVLGPSTVFHHVLQLYNITDMNYKLLLVALAALNFFICYFLEVIIIIIKKRNSIMNLLNPKPAFIINRLLLICAKVCIDDSGLLSVMMFFHL